MRKYLLVTPSYNRPYMIRQCICNAKNQTYKNFIHSIAIQREEETNYNILYDDIIDNRWVINYYKKPDLDCVINKRYLQTHDLIEMNLPVKL